MAAAAADAVSDDEFEVSDLSKDEVVNKYRQAADLVNDALMAVLKRCVPGADVLETCTLGDKIIQLQVSLWTRRGRPGSCGSVLLSVPSLARHDRARRLTAFPPLNTLWLVAVL